MQTHLGRQRSQQRTKARIEARRRVRRSKILHKVAAFSHLGETDLERAVDVMQYRHYDEGEILCSEGDAAEEFFVVVKGSCDVTVGVNAGAPTRVGHLGVLTCFGEAALAVESEERVRVATVTAMSDVEVLVMPRPAFQGLFGGKSANEALLAQVEMLRSQRLETNRERLSHVHSAGKEECVE